MSHAARRTNRGKCLLAAILLTLMIGAAQAMAAEDITGDWGVTVDSPWGPLQGTLTFEKAPDGALTGKWGARPLSNVKFENDQLTFARTIWTPDGDMTQNFKGTVKDGKLTGVVSTDQGESNLTGAKRKPVSPAVGVWDLKYTVGDRDVTAKLTISQKPDGTLDGKWVTEMGESTVSNVKFADGKLTLDRTVKFNDQEFKMTFTGTIQGDKLTGTSKSDMGEVPISGTRFGSEIIGKWELTSVSDMGTFTSLMVIRPDLTGTYEFFSDVPMKNLKFENGQLAFTVQFGPEDQPFTMDFKGKVEGNTLKGQMSSDRGTSDVTGKKLVTAAAAAQTTTASPAASAAPAAASGIVGTWEFTRQGRDGTPRTSTLKINPDMTGTYTMRDNPVPISDLKVDGNQVTFKMTMSFGGNESTQEFKGKVDGQTLSGAFISERGEREATGKKVQ
jgi:hypothetical protein